MTTTAAYFSTVDANHTVMLPKEIPVGSQVAVVVLPNTEVDADESLRTQRFQIVLDAIRSAIKSNFEPVEISDQDLNELIRDARQAAKAS